MRYESSLSQHKKELIDKDKDIANITNNLNSINTQGKNESIKRKELKQ